MSMKFYSSELHLARPSCTSTGQTALHLAAQFGNDRAVLALLNTGADSNIVDSKDESALSYELEPCIKCQNHPRKTHYHWDIVEALTERTLKLNFLELDVDRINYNHLNRSLRMLSHRDTHLSTAFYAEVDDAEEFAMSPLSLTLYDFLSDTNAVIRYSRMLESSRDVVDRIFGSIDTRFKEISSILKLQYRKAVTRFQLVEKISSLRPLIGFPLPALCADLISSFLTNADLKNVVAAVDLEN